VASPGRGRAVVHGGNLTPRVRGQVPTHRDGPGPFVADGQHDVALRRQVDDLPLVVAEEGPWAALHDPGVRRHAADVRRVVVVLEQRVRDAAWAAGEAVGGEVPRRGHDRVGRVVDVAAAPPGPGRRDEL